jgi:hypothetical protein
MSEAEQALADARLFAQNNIEELVKEVKGRQRNGVWPKDAKRQELLRLLLPLGDYGREGIADSIVQDVAYSTMLRHMEAWRADQAGRHSHMKLVGYAHKVHASYDLTKAFCHSVLLCSPANSDDTGDQIPLYTPY